MRQILKLLIVVLLCLFATVDHRAAQASDRIEDETFWDFNPFWWIWDDSDKWFNSLLAALKEPSLSDLAQKDNTVRVFRLIIDVPFSSVAASRVVVTPDGTVRLYTSRTEIDRELQPEGDGTQSVSNFDQSKMILLESAFTRNEFWDKDTHSSHGAPDLICDDLSRTFFHIEAVSGGQYKLLTQELCYTPPHQTNVGQLLVDYSKIVGTPLPKLTLSWKQPAAIAKQP